MPVFWFVHEIDGARRVFVSAASDLGAESSAKGLGPRFRGDERNSK